MKVAGVLGFAVAVLCSGSVFAFTPIPAFAPVGLSPTPVVAFGTNARRTAEAFAEEHKLNAEQVRHEHMASGLITCGDAHGAGQLTEANNVVTTAAHVLFDEEGNPRAPVCIFSLVQDGRLVRVPIDFKSIVAGSRKPYSVQAVHDWAVVKLEHPIDGVTPYQLADTISAENDVQFAARGHFDWGGGRLMSMESCKLYAQLNKSVEGTREFAFNCETGDGASGGAVLLGADNLHLGAILVGWRSNSPTKAVPFSPTHYNFVVSVEGAFKDAVLTAARRLVGEK
jgi:hypothetical protein